MKREINKSNQFCAGKKRSISSWVVAICLCIWGVCFTGCNEDAAPVDAGNNQEELQIGVRGINTRALDDAFETWDKIGLYVIQEGDTFLPSGNYADNVGFTLQDQQDTWLADIPIYYPVDGSKLDLYAYYPYADPILEAGSTIIPFTIRADQRAYADYTDSDLVIASTTGVARTSQKVHLTFDHKLSQLVFALKAGQGVTASDLQSARIVVKNAITDVRFDLSEGNPGIPVSGSNRSDVLPTGEWQVKNDNTIVDGYKAIIAPQELNETTYFEITLGSRLFTQRFTSPIEMHSGESRSFVITVNNTGLDISTTLNPWNYQGEYEGEATEEEDGEEEDPEAFIMEVRNMYVEGSVGFRISPDQYNYDFQIDWGDGSAPENYSNIESSLSNKISHTYNEIGEYIIRITGRVEYARLGDLPVTKIIQGGDIKLKSFHEMFLNCGWLTSIPDNMFASYKEVTNLNYTFKFTGLTSLPAGLFADCEHLTDLTGTFQACIYLTSLPEGLFSSCENIADFTSTFDSCINLASLPENLFSGCINTQGFQLTFGNCSNLTDIPESVFSDCINVEGFISTFRDCSNLAYIPENLFSNSLNVTHFSYTFGGCKNLKSIPENLFSSCVNAISFSDTFSDCKELTSLPGSLFAATSPDAKFNNTFSYCTALRDVPDELFERYPEIDFSNVFRGCTGLGY